MCQVKGTQRWLRVCLFLQGLTVWHKGQKLCPKKSKNRHQGAGDGA